MPVDVISGACDECRGALALLVVLAAAAFGAALAECPGLKPSTVDVDCRYFSKPVPCNQTQLLGTVARFRCKPLHEVLYNFRPASGNISVCRQDGTWSIKPFKCHPICGQQTGKGIPFVAGGKAVDSASMFPWHVIIYDKAPGQNQRKAICGGSLIKPKFIISAAHCFYRDQQTTVRAPSEFLVATGKIYKSLHSNDTQPQFRNITQIHIKDYGFARQNHANDIALVELETDVEITGTTMPICVDWERNQRPLRTTDVCMVVGWGGKRNTPYEELRYAKMPYLEREDCKQKVPPTLQVYATMDDKFCVSAIDGKNVAHGDSGGGIAVRSKSRLWFLRGVVSVGGDNVPFAFFTNVTVHIPWLSSIIREGEVKGLRCGVSDNSGRDPSTPGVHVGEDAGFPWDVEVYGINGTSDSYALMTRGVLIEPNLVAAVSWDRNTDALIGLMRPTALKVAVGRKRITTGLHDAVHVSRVRQVLYPDSLIRESFLLFTVALLELQSAIDVMPACVDWDHDMLQQKEGMGVTLTETPENIPARLVLPLLNSTTCKLTSSNFSFVNSYNLCANISGSRGYGQGMRYAMQEVDHIWFLRGVLGIESSNATVVLTDLADPSVMEWMVKARTVLGKSECGQFALRSVPLSDAPLLLHMPWNVAVLVTDSEGQTSSAGVLIRNNVVITSNANLVLPNAQSGGRDPAIDPENVTIAIREQDGTTRMVAVAEIHVHEEDYGSQWEAGWDTVLLKLETPVKKIPACLDLTGTTLSPMRGSQRGMVETWTAVGTGSEAVHSASYIERPVCQTMLKQTIFPTDVHCVGPFSEKLWSGSGFFTRAAEGWYLRGISAFHWKSELQGQIYSFTSLAHPPMVQWLTETLQRIPIEHEQHSEQDDSSAWLENVVVPKETVEKTQTTEAARGEAEEGQDPVGVDVTLIVAVVAGVFVLVVGAFLVWLAIRQRTAVRKQPISARSRSQHAHDNGIFSP